MREIIFRGKDEKTDEWVYGFYTLVSAGHGMKYAIITCTDRNCFVPVFVKTETIGQFTGVEDRHGKMIFEDDMVTIPRCGKGRKISIVYFKNGKFAVDGSNYSFKDLHGKVTEVIGNIYDNPELLTKAERHELLTKGEHHGAE